MISGKGYSIFPMAILKDDKNTAIPPEFLSNLKTGRLVGQVMDSHEDKAPFLKGFFIKYLINDVKDIYSLKIQDIEMNIVNIKCPLSLNKG
jgi:hypothetical protein